MESRCISEIIEQKVINRMDQTKECNDREIKEFISTAITEIEKYVILSDSEKVQISHTVFNSRRRMGIIQPLLDNPEVNEIMINGTQNIYIEQNNKLFQISERYNSKDFLYNVIQTIASRAGRVINESTPIVDVRLEDGSRLNAVLNPVSLNGPSVTIRKFAEKPYTMEMFIKSGTITQKECDFLIYVVKNRGNIFISGGTSSGKTTFLNVLASYIPEDQRIVTIEDCAELKLNHPNIVKMETRNANSEGKGEISMRQLIKASLRMRPDRIIIGEVRDESALDMLTALCTGHDGSMSTGHANSAKDMLVRLETMALWEGHISSEAIKRQIVTGIDLIVHLKREDDMTRKVVEISEISSIEKQEITVTPIFLNGQKIGRCTKKKFVDFFDRQEV